MLNIIGARWYLNYIYSKSVYLLSDGKSNLWEKDESG